MGEINHFKDNKILSDFILYTNKNFLRKKQTMKILENLSKLNKEKVIIKDNTNLDKNIKLSDENEDKKEKKKKTIVGNKDKQLSIIKEDSLVENLELNEQKNELEISIVGIEKIEKNRKNVDEILNLIKKCDEDIENLDKLIKKYQYSTEDLIMKSEIIDDNSMIFIDKKDNKENENNEELEKKAEHFKEIKNEFCILKKKLENLLSLYQLEKELTEKKKEELEHLERLNQKYNQIKRKQMEKII